MLRPIVVAIAAPVSPKKCISNGHKIILQMFASHKLRMAIAALPAPLKIPFNKKSNSITILPVSIICVNLYPFFIIESVAPIRLKIFFGKKIPARLIKMEMPVTSNIACAPDLAAPSEFFSPILLATNAVAAILSPNANEYTIAKTDSVNPTVAVAAEPSLPTKKISTTANMLSIHISNIIGMASRKTDLRMLPLVKSCCLVERDSFIKLKMLRAFLSPE